MYLPYWCTRCDRDVSPSGLSEVRCGYILFSDDLRCLNCGSVNRLAPLLRRRRPEVRRKLALAKDILGDAYSLVQLERSLLHKRSTLFSKSQLIDQYREVVAETPSVAQNPPADGLSSAERTLRRLRAGVDLRLARVKMVRWKNLIEPIGYAMRTKQDISPDLCVECLRAFVSGRSAIVEELNAIDAAEGSRVDTIRADVDKAVETASLVVQRMISDDVYRALRSESTVATYPSTDSEQVVPEEATAGLEDVMEKLQREIDRLDAEAELT